jgi:hypothetical protein
MNESKTSSLRTWEATRARGKWNFILGKGVLTWGGSMFVVMGVILPALSHSPTAFTPRGLLINALLWPIGGFLWGAIVWWLLERKYRKLQNATENRTQ